MARAYLSKSLEPTFILYDVLSNSRPPQPWSPNTWKARLVLNYKRIPYKTEWVSYPDIEATIKKLASSNAKMEGDKSTYTLPVIVDNSEDTPVIVKDSLEIARYLDTKFPDRPVLPEKGIAFEYSFEARFMQLAMQHFIGVVIPLTWSILDERGKAYFGETRQRWFGKTMEQMNAERHDHWEAVREGFEKLANMLDNGPGVDFVAGGSEPTRADFIVVSYLAFFKAIAPEEGWNERLRNWNGGRWQKLWDRSEEWRVDN